MGDSNFELVTVYACGDIVKLGFAQMILEEAGIPSAIQGEMVQDLFGMGRVGPGINLATGPAKLVVRREDLPRAIELLSEMDKEREASEGDEPDCDVADDSETE